MPSLIATLVSFATHTVFALLSILNVHSSIARQDAQSIKVSQLLAHDELNQKRPIQIAEYFAILKATKLLVT
jgi:hypothetical protein